MPFHVDVLQNDWLGGRQDLVARVVASEDRVDLEASNEEKWSRVLGFRPQVVASLEEGVKYLDRLSRAVQGSHLFVSSPHVMEECPFKQSATRPIEAARKPQPELA
jgi:hypothetical protein